MLEKDQIVHSESGEAYRICSLISSGTGQGDIYKVEKSGVYYAFKLFYPQDDGDMEHQVQTLLKRGKACPAYVHPLDVIHVDGRLGYVMEYIPDTFLSGSVLYNGVECDDHREELPFHVKISILHHLAEAISVLYRADLAMMDLKFDNIKINPEDWSIKILDIDTVVSSKDGKFFIEGTVGFMPPLTMRHQEVPNKYNDSFALAVILFMSLLGSHPLMGKLANIPQSVELETYLFADNPVYVWHPTDFSNRPDWENQRTADKLGKYPEAFLEGMQRTFVDGLFEREKRTTPMEWCEILRQVYKESYCCLECGEEQFIGNKAQFCDCCSLELKKPLLLDGDRSVPLFFGGELATSDVWNGEPKDSPFLKVVVTSYRGKFGFICEKDTVKLILPEQEEILFARGKVIPIFLDAVYQYKNKRFHIKEA